MASVRLKKLKRALFRRSKLGGRVLLFRLGALTGSKKSGKSAKIGHKSTGLAGGTARTERIIIKHARAIAR